MNSSTITRVLFVGAPGAGKTSVLEALQELGYGVGDDSARAIIRERKAAGLSPRPNPEEFAQQTLQRDIAAYEAAMTSPTFFERGVPDAVAMLRASGVLEAAAAQQLLADFPYFPKVFLFPAWREIYRTDEERDHTFNHAVRVHRSTHDWYRDIGYHVIEVPKATVAQRVQFVLSECGAAKRD